MSSRGRKRLYISKSSYYYGKRKKVQKNSCCAAGGHKENEIFETNSQNYLPSSLCNEEIMRVNHGEVLLDNSTTITSGPDDIVEISINADSGQGHSPCLVQQVDVNKQTKRTLTQHLASWAVIPGQIKSNVTALLKILQKFHPNLPGDFRSLLKTPRKISGIIETAGGRYIHFGLEEEIQKSMIRLRKSFHQIFIDIGIDGSPLFPKSGCTELWPIFGCIAGEQDVFMIGLFHGKSKPNDSNAFLRPFVDNLKTILANGVKDSVHQRQVPTFLRTIVCDSPAKALILGTINHNGKLSTHTKS
jgi:hypothetical protein